ncbi:MAG TPA: hypothetical protein VGO26_00960 [Amnibacterium sp.]|nr:hypothetical protein [Amnibacterium sp.]
MSTVTPATPGRAPLTTFTALRAVVVAALAVVVTFSADHTPPFGLAVFGVFAVVQGTVIAAGVRGFAVSRVGRLLVLLRGALLVVVGALSVSLVGGGGVGALLAVEIAGFLGAGALEVLSGLRRVDASPASRDLVTVGGLELLVGLMLAILLPDSIFAVGVLSAWGAIVAVYLGIAAVSIARREGATR